VVRQTVQDSPDPVRLGGVGVVVARALEALVPFEVRYVILGHVQRGGSPTPFDRILATRFGTSAVAALVDGESGGMVALRGDRIERVSLADVLARPRRVDPLGERVAAARSIGTIFGDEVRTGG
jgi:6-phosphofructokinase 1